MSNIERRYAYYDEGVLPEEGEYGVTYLTLYSSNAGNIYDGWVWDPDGKVPESFTERTYGYRNPDYEDYCWDDEVVVDLSNAQSRQESSEYIQGRITSFNTNVSDRPIILQDIDITGLTEEERENLSTTVLFSAIPLVQDAYIQANVEVQCKCNLSPDNTSGEMRIEAFYILNDESDRTMRPNPVHTFTVSSANERHTLPWLYWNPALRHQDHNYIGVKLIATGGTAEIGISDNPDYGDAMITLASAGLTGDRIDGGKPAHLEIFGKEEVVGGYELDPDDYTVLCTYDTGEIYEVTRMCTFSPAMGTPITDALTTLTAYYQGLRASMVIRLGMVESIELTGLEDIYEPYTLRLIDYTVFAYLDTGDIAEVTSECQFSPAMGTTIHENTTLTATYEPYWMSGSSFTDSLDISAHGDPIATASPNNGLVYKLYSDNHITITGDSHLINGPNDEEWEQILIPSSIKSMLHSGTEYSVEWNAEGCISGIDLSGFDTSFLKGFDDVELRPRYIKKTSYTGTNPIRIYFYNNHTITSGDLAFLKNINYVDVHDLPIVFNNNSFVNTFANCYNLTDLDFLSNIDLSYSFKGTYNKPVFTGTFSNCRSLTDISGIKGLDMSNTSRTTQMFYGCESLTSIEDTSSWKLYNVYDASKMYEGTGLISLKGCNNYEIGLEYVRDNPGTQYPTVSMMFASTKLEDLNYIDNWFSSNSVIKGAGGLFSNILTLKNLKGAEDWNMINITSISNIFKNCSNLESISESSGWRFPPNFGAAYAFQGCEKLEYIVPINNWPIYSSANAVAMFAGDMDVNGSLVSMPSLASEDISCVFGQLGGDGKISIFEGSDEHGRIYGHTQYGMFAQCDRWEKISTETGIKIRFFNPSKLPSWYMNMISENLGYPIIS